MSTTTHTARAELKDANPKIYPLMRALTDYLEVSSIDGQLRHLMKIRASQINGCAFCLDMHLGEARKDGISQERLDLLCVWREASYFTDAERVALELTEAVTLISQSGVTDALCELVRKHY